jgi:hypothetical protein
MRAVFICMSPTPHTAQAERNEVKSKPAPLRLRRLRGYAQGERESNQGYTQVKIALVQKKEATIFSPSFG